MRFMKSMMAIAALCAAALTMMGVARKRKNGMRGMRKGRSRWARQK